MPFVTSGRSTFSYLRSLMLGFLGEFHNWVYCCTAFKLLVYEYQNKSVKRQKRNDEPSVLLFGTLVFLTWSFKVEFMLSCRLGKSSCDRDKQALASGDQNARAGIHVFSWLIFVLLLFLFVCLFVFVCFFLLLPLYLLITECYSFFRKY